MLYIGLMSGTSMDGIDAALVDVDSHVLIKGITRAYSPFARQFLDDVLSARKTGLGVMSQLNTVLGLEFADAVHQLLQQANVPPEAIQAIGSHGQTITHNPTADIPYTVQLGCGHTIATGTGMTVIADFRTRDLVLGGQGAPFAPLYHKALFGLNQEPLAIVNIGGIANVTFIVPGKQVTGYDTGPGNGLLDAWVQAHLKQPFDANGEWAASGRVIESLLQQLLTDPYFKLQAPKSLDKAYFSKQWLKSYLALDYLPQDYLPQDVQATLTALTAISITNAIKQAVVEPARVLVCGGGVHNGVLLGMMQEQLPELAVESTQSLGVSPDFLEAMMFAWLADKTLKRIPLDCTPITGAKRAGVLGVVYAA